ncbi:MAG TPA: endonuclease/exonuclease/phosphatase family protein [Casimicrobiaceae bacterium]|nr:endonuclease/exonuclease/phosphatase family protein [Casimicrobiaceae bacterium]
MRFTVATYNIHKGFSQLNRRMVIHELKEKLHGLAVDVLFLQEVLGGVHRRRAGRYRDWPGKPQHEFIADTVWHEVAYGRNAVTRHGHHGNAILSRFPIVAQAHQDISAHVFENRGLLHCVMQLRRDLPPMHCINVHLGLFERGRRWQVHALTERIRAAVPAEAPLIIAGDFNDWRRKADRSLKDDLEVLEVFSAARGRLARTFPAVLPLFRLDRIYARGLKVVAADIHYAYPLARLSDHAALAATFELVRPRPSTR